MTPTHAEYVTFHLTPGTALEDFIAAARITDDLLSHRPGYLARHLSRGSDGRWTDCVLWASADSAMAAGEAIMSDPRAAPFMALIAPEGMEMRHETLHWQKA